MCHWVETLVCTKPLPKPRSNLPWRKIYDAGHFQIWICESDLKDGIVHEAEKAFGKTLEQIVRIGNYPQVLYPSGLNT